MLRQQELASGEAVVLYLKAGALIGRGMEWIRQYWARKQDEVVTSSELNTSESYSSIISQLTPSRPMASRSVQRNPGESRVGESALRQ